MGWYTVTKTLTLNMDTACAKGRTPGRKAANDVMLYVKALSTRSHVYLSPLDNSCFLDVLVFFFHDEHSLLPQSQKQMEIVKGFQSPVHTGELEARSCLPLLCRTPGGFTKMITWVSREMDGARTR